MRALANLSNIIIPFFIFFIVGHGFVARVKVYESFLKGAKEGLKIVVDIVPTLIGLLVAVGMLRASGFFDMLGNLLAPVTDSYAGLLTSILMSCTETVFYTMSVYFLAAKVTKTRYTLTGALLATLAGTVASVVLAGRMV